MMQFLYCVLKNALKIIKMINFYVHSFSFLLSICFSHCLKLFYVFKCPYLLRRMEKMVFRRLVWDVFFFVENIWCWPFMWFLVSKIVFRRVEVLSCPILMHNFPCSGILSSFFQLAKITWNFWNPPKR